MIRLSKLWMGPDLTIQNVESAARLCEVVTVPHPTVRDPSLSDQSWLGSVTSSRVQCLHAALCISCYCRIFLSVYSAQYLVVTIMFPVLEFMNRRQPLLRLVWSVYYLSGLYISIVWSVYYSVYSLSSLVCVLVWSVII